MTSSQSPVHVGVVDQGKEEKLERYVAHLRALGADVTVLRWTGDAAADAGSFDGLVLCGGDDVDARHFGEPNHPTVELVPAIRDVYEIALVREAARRQVPLLGVCRGSQIMNVALGGSLIQHIPDVAAADPHNGGVIHQVLLAEGSTLRGVAGAPTGNVNSFHHQAVGRLAATLSAAAHTPDGVVEAVESDPKAGGPAVFFVGVQWHPEREGNDPALAEGIFAALVDAARNRRMSKPG